LHRRGIQRAAKDSAGWKLVRLILSLMSDLVRPVLRSRTTLCVMTSVVRRRSFSPNRFKLVPGRSQPTRDTKHKLGPETPSSRHMVPPLIALTCHRPSLCYSPTLRPSTARKDETRTRNASFPTSGRWNGPLAGQSVVSSP
jgi:hypothetical protein